MNQQTEKLINTKATWDQWEENFKKVVNVSFKNALKQIEFMHPKFDIKKSLYNPSLG